MSLFVLFCFLDGQPRRESTAEGDNHCSGLKMNEANHRLSYSTKKKRCDPFLVIFVVDLLALEKAQEGVEFRAKEISTNNQLLCARRTH